MYQRVAYISLLMVFFLSSCRRDEDYMTIGNPKAMSVSDIIRFSGIDNPGIADGESPVMLTVHINPISDSLNRQISISTSLGYFSNNDTTIDLTVDGYGDIHVPLISAKAGIAAIRASIGQYLTDTSVIFSEAIADDMTFTSDKYVMDTTMTADLTCTLFRGKGQPTDPVKVGFVVTPDNTSLPSLIAPSFVYTASHVASGTLANPFHSLGWFSVTAYMLRSATDTLKRSIRVKVE